MLILLSAPIISMNSYIFIFDNIGYRSFYYEILSEKQKAQVIFIWHIKLFLIFYTKENNFDINSMISETYFRII